MAEPTPLFQSIENALSSNPDLQTLKHGRQALAHDLKQFRSSYLPSVDLTLGYGVDQHSDRTTRQSGAKPDDTEWDSREQATLKMTQKLYDGGETGGRVSAGKAELDAANHQLTSAVQTISLNAVMAHVDILRQQELEALAKKNLAAHREIHELLVQREQAGISNIADVAQVRARMARAESTWHSTRAELTGAMANYARVTGAPPDSLAYAGPPETLPKTLEEALEQTKKMNPELMALSAELEAADASLSLARSNHKPKIDLELSSKYTNQLEGDPSWENTNSAVVLLHWNLYQGGGNKAGVNAALSRKHQRRAQHAVKWFELKKTLSTTWAYYQALGKQKLASRDAVEFSRKTFDAYLNQFSVSQRTLVDVLIAENDFFQSASQLIDVQMDETIAAYQILAIMGAIDFSDPEPRGEDTEAYKSLIQSIAFPPALALASSPDRVGHKTEKNAFAQNTNDEKPVSGRAIDERAPTKSSPPLYSLQIGPILNGRALDQTQRTFKEQGLDVKQRSGPGQVKMIRLLEGIYKPAQARRRLLLLKKSIDSAFVLPHIGGLGLYAGSFRPSDRVNGFIKELEGRQIKVKAVPCNLEMKGPLLVVGPVKEETAEAIALQMSQRDISVKTVIYSDNRQKADQPPLLSAGSSPDG